MTVGKQKRDFMEVARGIVEQAIGEQMNGDPLPPPSKDDRNPHAVALGSMGGKKGGKARAKMLSPAKRRSIAKMPLTLAGTNSRVERIGDRRPCFLRDRFAPVEIMLTHYPSLPSLARTLICPYTAKTFQFDSEL